MAEPNLYGSASLTGYNPNVPPPEGNQQSQQIQVQPPGTVLMAMGGQIFYVPQSVYAAAQDPSNPGFQQAQNQLFEMVAANVGRNSVGPQETQQPVLTPEQKAVATEGLKIMAQFGMAGSEFSEPGVAQSAVEAQAFKMEAAQAAQDRPGYYGLPGEGLSPTKTVGDEITEKAAWGLQQFAILGMANPRFASDREYATAFSAEGMRSYEVAAGDIRGAQYYGGELQKIWERPIEQASEYHYLGAATGIPVPANPWEYKADLAVEMLKGAPQKSSEMFSPVSGEASQHLPGGGYGLQQWSWDVALHTDRPEKYPEAPVVSFAEAVRYLGEAEGQYGPYGSLFGGPAYVGTPSSSGIRMQAGFVFTPEAFAKVQQALTVSAFERGEVGKPTAMIGGAPVPPSTEVGPDVMVRGPDLKYYPDYQVPWGNASAVSPRLKGEKVVAACAKITDNANAMVAGTGGIGKGTGAAMTVWELTPENSGLSANTIAMIQWGATEGQTRANEFFAPPKPFVSKSEPAKVIPPVEPIGVIGGYERAVFDLGFVNIMDVMKGPAGKAAAIVVPGAAGFVWHAEFVAGSPGAQKQGEYEYGGYSVVSERAGQSLQEITGFNAARLETYAAKPETGFIETFGASAGATVLRNPGQLPVAATQGVILSPLFEGIGVSSAFAGARIGGKISATAGVTAAKVAERVIPTAIFGGMVAYGVTNKFEDFSAKGMTMRAGAMAPSTIAMITPIIIMPRIGENLTWRAINKAAKTPEEQSMVNSLKDIQSLTKGVDTGIRHPPKFEEIKYVGEEGAGPLGKVLKEEPGIVFGGTTMQTQMKAKEIPRQTADIDWMVYKSGEGVERLAEKTAAKMGEPFRAEGNLVVREIPGQEHAPHAVDIHSYMERGGEYTPPFKMELPVSKVVTIKGISYEPLYLQETRKVSAALGIRTEEGWEFFPESEAHRLVKDIGDVPAVGRAFIEPLQKQHDLLAPIRGSKAVRLEKAITEYEQNPLVRGYIEEYHRMYAGKEILTTERAAPPQMTSQYYATLGAPSMYIGVSKFVGSPPSMAPSPRYSIPSSIPPSSIRRSSVLPSVPSIISYSPSPSKASSMRSSLAPSTPGYPSYLSVPSLSTGRTPSPPSTKAPSSRISTPPYSPPYTPPSRGPSTPSYTPPSSPPYSPPYRLPPPSSPPPIPVIFPGGGGGAGPGYRGKRTWVNVHPVGADILGATRGNVFRLPEPMPTRKGKKKKIKPWFPEF